MKDEKSDVRKRHSVAETNSVWLVSQPECLILFDWERCRGSRLRWSRTLWCCQTGGPSCDFKTERNHQHHSSSSSCTFFHLNSSTPTNTKQSVHTVRTSGTTMSRSVTASDLQQLKAATRTLLSLLWVLRVPFSTAYKLVEIKKTAQCVWAVLKTRVSLYKWKLAVWLQLHLPACKEVISGRLAATVPTPSICCTRHTRFVLMRKWTGCDSTVLPLKISG